MTKPLLTYEIKTNPTPVLVSEGVTITLLVSNPGNTVSLSEIVFNMGLEGGHASNLSANLSKIPSSSPKTQGGWDLVQDGNKIKITPQNTAAGTINSFVGLIFNIGPIPVNAIAGTATVSVSENTGEGLSDPLEFPISKWPADFKFSDFEATHPSVEPGATAELSWKVAGANKVILEYQGIPPITNPTPNPFTTQGLGSSTVFTLTAKGSIAGEDVHTVLQTTVEVTVPVILNKSPTYDIVYMGQGNTLHWTAQQSDHCELRANGVLIDPTAPCSTGAEGYVIDASVMKSTTTFQLVPVKGSKKGEPKEMTAFAKTLSLKSSFPSHSGWGQVAVQQQGQTAYICNTGTNALDIVSMSTGQVEASVKVGLGPRGISLSTDGNTAYVSNAFDDTVSIVDLVGHKVTGSIAVPSPAGSAVLGGTAFVASIDPAGAAIVTLNLETATNTGNMRVGGRPFDVAVNPNGQSLYVANNAGTTVDIYDVATSQKSGSVDVNDAPTTVAISGNGASVYAGSRLGSDISVINSHIAAPAITTTTPAYMNPAAIGVSGSGQFMAVVGPTGFFVFELGLPAGLNKLLAESEGETEKS